MLIINIFSLTQSLDMHVFNLKIFVFGQIVYVEGVTFEIMKFGPKKIQCVSWDII